MTQSLAHSAAGPGDRDLVVLERASLSPLIELARSAAPGLRVDLKPSSLLHAVVHLPGLPSAPVTDCVPEAAIAAARRILKLRRRRDLLIGADLFGEPVWDLVLDLFIAQAERKRTCVSNACLSAQVPSSTALRWMRELEARGLLHREDDPDDGRRVYVALSQSLYESVRELLES